LKELLERIVEILREVTPEVYYELNTSPIVRYPYAVFNIDMESIERNQEGATLEIDLFDNSGTKENLLDLETELRRRLEYYRDLSESLNLTFSFQTSLSVPTLVKDLTRRNITFYIKIDWRKENYGTT
jgi:hypothetical protein